MLFRLCRALLISIPSGAIKSNPKWYINGDNKKFQFLLVRLRESGAAITSSNSFPFQFLLVRLRENLLVKNDLLNPDFNSFWCD